MEDAVTQLHMNHVRALLARVRDGHNAEGDPDGIFLGAEDGEFFQELVGFRLAGMRSTVLAVLRFQKHGLPGIPFARESLAGYLARPPAAPRTGPFAAPARKIVALMPRAYEPIPRFLEGLRAGRDTPSMVVDPRQIRVAFDFRGYNPSALETDKQRAGPLRTFAIRTVAGQVLTGRSHDLGGAEDHRFLALTEAVQIMPRGRLRLPNVMLNASWVATWTDVTEEATRLAAAHWIPFLAAEASADIVLGLPPGERTRAAPKQVRAPASRFPGSLARG